MCMFWVSCSCQWLTMEGASESGCRNSENSRVLGTSGASDRNLRRATASIRTALSGEGSQNSGSRKGREWHVTLRGDRHKQLAGSADICEDVAVANPRVPDAEWDDVSLRQWLDKPDRSVDVLECLHIFRQIVEIVQVAHSQGIVVHNVRPSCFVMSSFNHVSFIDSASDSDSGSECLEDALHSQTAENQNTSALLPPQNVLTSTAPLLEMSCMHPKLCEARSSLVEEQTEENKTEDKRNVEDVEGNKQPFPMKQILLMEETNWYTSPEEEAGDPSSCASDIYRLGVLLFEIFCPLITREEKRETMSSLRHRVLPPHLLLKWPKEASFCVWLLHPEPSSRPTLGDLLKSDFLDEQKDDLQEQEVASELQERIEEQKLLLEFLLIIQQRKQEAADKLERTVSFLCSDIGEVTKQQMIIKKTASTMSEPGKDDHPASNPLPMTSVDGDDSACLGSRKRVRPGVFIKGVDESNDKQGDNEKIEGNSFPINSRLLKNFKKLESAYFLTRCRQVNPLGSTDHWPETVDGRGSANLSQRASVHSSSSNRWFGDNSSGWINPFLQGLCKYLSFSKISVRANLKQADLLNSSNLVCSVGFDCDGEFFATAGLNKKIKVFEWEATICENRAVHYPVVEMVSSSKLSSICWNTYIKSQIASSNFEGVVQVWDAARSQVISEMREHEHRVWSVDFSSLDPTLLASGSDDFSVKLWSINQAESAVTIKTKANVCCVQFAPESGHFLAFGSADHKIYYYDLRNSKMPLYTLVGHSKTVSHVKFVDSINLLSSSTDNSLKLWDLSMSESRVIDTPVQSFSGHLNVKNFVGLSVSDGFIATGSETNEVFVYYKAFAIPALSFKFQNIDPISGLCVDDTTQFISSVCWRGQSSTLVAANSTGNVKILEMV